MQLIPIETNWDMILRLLLSIGVGAIIGLERELRGVPAGMRTNALVCIGSTLFTMASLLFFSPTYNTADAHVAAQIVVGIGFLGGGTIFKEKNRVTGLTTAANMWVLAALGMLIGLGQFIVAIVSAILILALLIFGKFWERKALERHYGRH